MKVGIIGCGNMGRALIAGLSRENAFEIHIFDIDVLKENEAVSRWAVRKSKSPADLAVACPVLILAVKPHDIESVLKEIKIKFDSGKKILISIAAGIRVSAIRKYLKKTLIAR